MVRGISKFHSYLTHLWLIMGALFLLATPSVHAQKIESEIKADATVKSVTVPAGYTGNEVSAYFLVSGNMSQIVDLYFGGLANTSVSVKAKLLPKGGAAEALSSSSGWNTLSLNDGKSSKDRNSFRLASTSASALMTSPNSYTPSAVVDVCAILTPENYAELRHFMLVFTGRNYTDAELCELYRTEGLSGAGSGGGSGGGGTYDPTSGNQFGSASTSGIALRAILHKDTCGASSKSKYLVKLSMDLSQVDPATLAQGFEAKFGAYIYNFNGSRKASLKPKSEGRYAPSPLLLMSAIGYGSHKVNIVQWKDGKIKSNKALTKHDFIYWGGSSYARFPLSSKVMSGKKETVEVSGGGGQLYSVCFQMAKKRQKLFGYK